MIHKAFILAGGKGERLRPLTDETPKPMLEVSGKPILQHAIDWLEYHGVQEIVLGVGYQHEKIMHYFGNGRPSGARITYSVEGKPLGTGGAVKAAQEMLGKEPFIMLNGDNLMDVDYRKMAAVHEKNKALATIALVEVKDVTGYGVARLQGEKITEFVEKPAPGLEPSKRINAGCYVLEPKALDFIPDGFSLIEKTAFPALAKKGRLYAFSHVGQWFPTDDPPKWEAAKKAWKPPV